MIDTKTKAMLYNKIANEVDQDGYYRQEATRLAHMEKYWNEKAVRIYIVNKEESLRKEREETIQALLRMELEKLEEVGA